MEDELQAEGQAKPRLPNYVVVGGILAGVSALSILFIITTRQPGIGGPITVLIFLGLLFVGCIGLFLLLSELLFRSFKMRRFSGLRLFYTSILTALGVVFVIGLQTLGQLQLIDVVLLVLFEVLLNFYLLRRF